MTTAMYVVGLVPILIAFGLTLLMRRISLARGLMDVPNARSSHAVPTPRGGGVAIVLASAGAFCVLFGLGAVDFNLFATLVGGGMGVAVVGLIDDRRPLPAQTRLVVHIGSAVWALFWLGPPHLPFAGETLRYALALLGIVWLLNLYNFMDGIDGIAASEAVFVSWGGAFLLLLTHGSAQVSAAAVAFGAACSGFLLWNWPPAKIFMGDVGSGYIGYIIAVLALASGRETPSYLAMWLVLSGVFVVDATVTLLRRLVRRERVFAAHRSHAYQWLARRWRSHKKVTVGVLAINLLWLLPCACIATVQPNLAGRMLLIALFPLVVIALLAGAGRREVGAGLDDNPSLS